MIHKDDKKNKNKNKTKDLVKKYQMPKQQWYQLVPEQIMLES